MAQVMHVVISPARNGWIVTVEHKTAGQRRYVATNNDSLVATIREIVEDASKEA